MCLDRVAGDGLPQSHETLAAMRSAQRCWVTLAEAADRRPVEAGGCAAPPGLIGGVRRILRARRLHVVEGGDVGAPGASAGLCPARGVRLGAERADLEPKSPVAEDAAPTAAEGDLGILGNGF